ncbi:HEAT repeat domain-containing protein [Phytomonospora sp. NPDC050363]|uniref:HEAT repeat domain-containing protein n=1 Tax=Phytomonospora sp. NPDC050363 TaxID=3155642 RepID=UPI0033CEDEED
MPMFVHLTPRVDAARIRRAGIRAVSHGREGSRGVYCFPVLPSYTLTHQWLRELARHKSRRGMVAVHFRVADDEQVTVGRYSAVPEVVGAAEAVGRIAGLDDPRGWEVLIRRGVSRREVHKVREVSQGLGWRYKPDVHGTRPCPCCQPLGSFGSRRLRDRPGSIDPPAPPPRVLLARLDAAAPDDVAELESVLHWFGRRRRGPVDRLAPLADHPAWQVRESLAWAIGRWRTPGAAELLARLADDSHPDVREAVADIRA